MYLQCYIIVTFYIISSNSVSTQDFFQLQLSPSTLTSISYLEGEVSVYEHKQNRSRLFIPPLALLNLNNTKILYRQLDKQDLLREVSVYEHKQNRSRLFIPPLALLNLNNTKILYRQLDKQDLLRISLILSTNELRQTILQYLSYTHLRCNRSQELCEVKMIPIELFRIVWSRPNPFSSDYLLDSSWQSNTQNSNHYWAARNENANILDIETIVVVNC
ncbi:unnamed protein product [Adineta ricciae]|uniref:Uncharacterized protein n=1 Tax=Adineta ricciae TaxID=249248 RepID=A0A815QK29_ADIRI|nr:unnamed protein product [Adineta ricciae]